MHFGIKPRGIKRPSDRSFSEGKRVNEAERKPERRRMSASSQRVEGYSFLILFCEVDPSPPAESRERCIFQKSTPYTISHTIPKKSRLKKQNAKSILATSLSLSPYLLYYTGALLARRLFPYTWIENLSARARCMRTGGSKQIVLSYARPVGHLCAAREELK